MNLTEALDLALPELPARRAAPRSPRVHPKLIGRQHVEEGVPIVIAHVQGSSDILRFLPEQWQLLQLFDGERSYEEIALEFKVQTGIEFSEEDVKEFAAPLDAAGVFQKSAYEQNVAAIQKLRDQQRSRFARRWRMGDITYITFSAWDPDRYLTEIHEKLRWVYGPWFTGLTLVMVGFMTYIFIDRWDEIGRDTLKYYQFSEKSFLDIAEFWLLFLVIGFIHESAHGLTCKHYGGGVHRMGAHLTYLMPGFFVDVTEAWVYGGRWQRLATIIAGIWVEMILCSVVTVVWWGTPAGSFLHDFAYKIILFTGVGVVVINMNPLIKLDGYYAFCELVGVPDIKEKSTSYVSSWVQRHVFRLPAEVPYLTSRQKFLYVPYAIMSGLYGYMLLFFVARWSYNVAYRFNPEWAFAIGIVIAYLIFKSRIHNLVRFMKNYYVRKQEWLRAALNFRRSLVAATGLALVFFLPWWRESVEGRFILEPAQRAEVRTEVPGTVMQVLADEGQVLNAGAPIVVLRSLALETEEAKARAELAQASSRAFQAELQYTGYGSAERERQRLLEKEQTLTAQTAKLRLSSPISGVVATPRVRDRLGSYLPAGTVVAEIDNISSLRARTYIAESEIKKLRPQAAVRLHFDGLTTLSSGQVASVSPANVEMEPGLVSLQGYAGMRPPRFYTAIVKVANSGGQLRVGMTGSAKILVRRRSPAGIAWEQVHNFWSRKIW